MKEKLLKYKKQKFIKYIILCIVILIIISILILNRKKYNVFLDLYMPSDSHGSVVYSPGNQNEFNLYIDSYLNIECIFSDNKKRKINYIVSNSDIIDIENNKIYAKNIGSTTIYVKTKNNIKSNLIKINVVNNDE